MGAYENPITVIDTESAKMWQQASANIAQFSINTMNAINARKTKEAKEQEAEATDRTAMAIENQQAVIDRITRAGVKSDAYFQYGMALMDDVTRLQGDLKYFSGTEEEKSAMLSELSDKQKNISQLVTQGAEVQDAIGDYLKRRGVGKDGKEASPDTPNGMVMVGNEKMVRYHKVMGALSGLDKGALESVYMKNGALYAKIEGVEGEVNLSTETKFDTGEVIDSSKLIKDALVDGGIVDNKNNYNQKKYLNQDLVDVVTSKTPTGKTIQKTVIPYDIDRITTDALMAINNQGLAVLKSQDENSIRGWYMLNAGENAGKLNFVNEVGGVNKTLDEESTKKWLDVWNREGKKQIPDYVEITDENVDQFNDAVVGQYRLNLKAKQGDAKLLTPDDDDTDKPKPYQVRASEDFDDFINNPTGFVEKYLQGGDTISQNGNIITVFTQPRKENEKVSKEIYDITNPNDIFKLFYDEIEQGNAEIDNNYRAEIQRLAKSFNKKNPEKSWRPSDRLNPKGKNWTYQKYQVNDNTQ